MRANGPAPARARSPVAAPCEPTDPRRPERARRSPLHTSQRTRARPSPPDPRPRGPALIRPRRPALTRAPPGGGKAWPPARPLRTPRWAPRFAKPLSGNGSSRRELSRRRHVTHSVLRCHIPRPRARRRVVRSPGGTGAWTGDDRVDRTRAARRCRAHHARGASAGRRRPCPWRLGGACDHLRGSRRMRPRPSAAAPPAGVAAFVGKPAAGPPSSRRPTLGRAHGADARRPVGGCVSGPAPDPKCRAEGLDRLPRVPAVRLRAIASAGADGANAARRGAPHRERVPESTRLLGGGLTVCENESLAGQRSRARPSWPAPASAFSPGTSWD
jgi:hypothetical protein